MTSDFQLKCDHLKFYETGSYLKLLFKWSYMVQEERIPPCYSQVGGEVEVSPLASDDIWKERLLITDGQGWDFQSPVKLPLVSPWLEREGVPHYGSLGFNGNTRIWYVYLWMMVKVLTVSPAHLWHYPKEGRETDTLLLPGRSRSTSSLLNLLCYYPSGEMRASHYSLERVTV